VSPESAPAPLRRLGLALRGLRLDAGLTGHQLAALSGLSQSAVSRIELGQAMPSLPDIDAWCQATRATAGEAAEIRGLAEAAAVETISWRGAARRGLPRLQDHVRDLEATATTLLDFQPVIIPGLLQTADYARQVVLSVTHQEGLPYRDLDVNAGDTGTACGLPYPAARGR
jgi:transcriptional regulator with XRE-family HTH domain